VPAGDYTVAVSGEDGRRNASTYNEVVCVLDASGTQIARQDIFRDVIFDSEPYGLVGVASLPSGGTISLTCSSNTTDSGVSYTLADNSLVVSKVDAIN
jgi:hypothetical protein